VTFVPYLSLFCFCGVLFLVLYFCPGLWLSFPSVPLVHIHFSYISPSVCDASSPLVIFAGYDFHYLLLLSHLLSAFLLCRCCSDPSSSLCYHASSVQYHAIRALLRLLQTCVMCAQPRRKNASSSSSSSDSSSSYSSSSASTSSSLVCSSGGRRTSRGGELAKRGG